jgi:hypothetical protein
LEIVEKEANSVYLRRSLIDIYMVHTIFQNAIDFLDPDPEDKVPESDESPDPSVLDPRLVTCCLSKDAKQRLVLLSESDSHTNNKTC